MHTTVNIDDKPVAVELSHAAADALAQRDTPLLAEMELLFSCLIRKKVRFREDPAEDGAVTVTDRLTVSFRPVMTCACRVDDLGNDKPQVTDFPLTNAQAFVPRWLRIDYRNSQWHGEFGYRH